ncbi:hypothetical protein FB45DRAFT_1032068 [Roridomyces roridus]|uniref:Uncharacterized protein n=1 Tax=Roridomyces roridus TaxID=1738132 RepID=A0AAD7BIV4_9AGAR|nr:hypothetical protein FB45DRAFT_1032068 [Roridomyces roridus]
MCFRQKGHESEDPVDFFQRRIKYLPFLFEEQGDGPMMVARVLRTQPSAWAKDVSHLTCATLADLQSLAEHNAKVLISSWNDARKLKLLSDPKPVDTQRHAH